MTTESSVAPERSYGCTFGCGNPYDYVMIDVRSGTTEFLCLPDLIRLASDLVAAVTESPDETMQAALAYAQANPENAAPGPNGRRRGRNAPATNESSEIFAAYDATITTEDLSDEFK